MTALSPRTVPAVSRRLRARRNSLLFSCAMGASLVLAGQATPARAQAINATPATSGGNVTYNRSTPGIETVTVETQQAIINWTPPAGTTNPYVFLPSGNTVTFQNGVNVSNFAVLNRILTTLPSRFDGTVISQLRDASGNVTGRGGTVVFSSPGGIIVGSTAVFDVGNLVLTSLTVAEDGYGNFLSPNGGFQYELSGGETSGSIITEAGSQINALSENSYVALVAPQVTHAGSIRVNGSVGFIAAEQVSFSVNEGLFDIQVTTGSGNATPIVHTGTTGGPASTGGTDNHAIYAVAVPKNQAITMLLSGSVGYDEATDVTIENGEIVLSAGYNISAGAIADRVVVLDGDDIDVTPESSISIADIAATSDVTGRATHNAIATATRDDPLTFDGSLSLQAGNLAAVEAGFQSNVAIGGDLTLIADDLETGAAGTARIFGQSGSFISVGGNLTLSADAAIANTRTAGATGESAQGGTAQVDMLTGILSVAGDVDLSATATAGPGTSTGGNATGGIAYLNAAGGTIDIAGNADIDTTGTGGYGPLLSGNGTGGFSGVQASNFGFLFVTGDLNVSAYGVGGSPPFIICEVAVCPGATTQQGGDGTGGVAQASVSNGTLSFGSVFLDASGFGGRGNSGGDGSGGLATITGGGTLTVNGFTGVYSEGGGGAGLGFGLDTATSGNGTGGTASIVATPGASFTFNGDVEVFADGQGSFFGGVGGGDGTGGTALVSADAAAIDVTGELLIVAPGFGTPDGDPSNGFTPGTGTGGTASLELSNGATLGVDFGITLYADGGTGTIFTTGSASGGPIVCVECIFIAPPSIFDFVSPAGNGVGGTVNVLIRNSTLTTTDLYASAAGIGGAGFDGSGLTDDGGPGFAGTGGEVTIEFDSAGGSILDTITVDVRGGGGIGGSGFDGGAGGNGIGGSATLVVTNGEPQLGEITLAAGGYGGPGGSGGGDDSGNAGTGGTGGTGTGGDINVEAALGGVITLDTFSFDARGQGGDGGNGGDGFDFGGLGGTGGDGFGGEVALLTTGGEIEIANADGLALNAPGFGGDGGDGGDSQGDLGPGGAGGAAGDGTGGTAEIEVAGGSITSPVTSLDSSGFGGVGGAGGLDFNSTSSAPGANGNGAGGLSRISIADGNGTIGNASLGFTTMRSSGISGSGFTTVGDIAGLLVFEDLASGAVLLEELNAISTGAASPDGPGFDFSSSDGAVLVAADVTVDVSGDVNIAATGTGGLRAGGAVSVTTGGSVTLDHQARASDAPTVSGASVNLAAQNAVTGNSDSLVTGGSGDVLVSAASVDLGRITATRDLIIDAGDIAFDFGTAGRDIALDASGNIDIGFAEAGDDFTASASGTFTADTVIANGTGEDTEVDSSFLVGSNIDVFTFGDLRLDNGDAVDDIDLRSVGAGVSSAVLLDAGGNLRVVAGADTGNIVDIDLADAIAGGTMDLSATGSLTADTLTAGSDITATVGGDATVADIGTGGSLFLFADGAVDLGIVNAAADVIVDPTSITIDSVTAGDDITLDATGDITVGFAQAGDDFTANAGGIFTGGTVIVTGLGTDDEAGYGSGEGSNIFVDANGDLRLDNGSAPDTIDLASATGSVFSAGTLTANQLLISAALNIDLNDVDVVSSLFLSTSNGFIDGNNFSSDGGISLSASGGVTLAAADSGSFLFINAGGAADLGTLVSDSSITIFAPSILLDSATAGADINLDASGDILVGFAQAGDDFTASAGGIFTGGTVIATGLGPDNEAGYGSLEGANIVIDSNGNLTLTNGDAADAIRLTSFNASVLSTGLLDAGTDIDIAAVQTADLASLVAGNNITVDPVTIIIDSAIAGGDITLDASADVTVGFAQAGDDFVANAGTTFTGTTVIAQGVKDSEAGVGPLGGGNIVVNAGTDLRLDNGNAADDIRLTSRAGSIFSSTLLTAGSDVIADAAQDIDVVTVDAGDFVNLSAGGLIDAASLIAGNSITSTSGGATTITAADAGDSIFVSAGGAAGLGTLGAGEDIFVDAASITLANGTAGSDISLGATGNIDVVSATVGDDFDANAGGTFNGTTIVATGGPDDDLIEGPFPGSNIIVDAVGDLRLDTGTAPDLIDLASSGGSIFSSGTLTADTLVASAALDLLLNDVFVVTDLNLTTSNGDIAGNSFNSDGNITLDSAGSVTLAEADSGGDIDVAAGTNADLGTFFAAGDILVDAASIAFASATAGGDVGLAASGDIGITFAQAGDDFIANAGGTFTGGTVTVTGLGTDSEGGAGALAGSNIQVDANGNLRLDNGTAPGAIDLASATGSILSSGTLTADRLVADAALDIALNNVSVVADLALTTPGGSISGNSFDSGGDISLDAAGSVTLAAADSGGNIDVAAGTTATIGTFVAAGNINVDAASIALASATAGGDIGLAASGDIAVTFAQAGDDFVADAGGTFTGGTVTVTGSGTDGEGGAGALAGSNIQVDANGDLRLDNATAPGAIDLASAAGSVLSSGTLTADRLQADAAIDLALNNVAVGADLALTAANGSISGNSFDSGGDISLDAAGSVTLAAADSGGNIDVTAGTTATLGTFVAVGDILVDANGNVRLDNGTAGGTIDLASATGSVLSGGTLAANRLVADAAEDIALNNVDVVADLILTAANGSISGNNFESDGNISLDSAEDVLLAAADSGGALLISTGGTADLGVLSAVTDIGVDADQINLASATAGRDITLDSAGDIDVGTAQAGRNFTADAGGDGAFGNLAAASVAISVLGNASFDGAVRAPTISVVSSDIDVAATASLGDSATQLLTLTALATGQPTVLGGSTEGPGYTLTDAEADRITSALFRVQAPQNGSGANRAADVLVRDLSLSGQRIGTFALFTGGIVQVEGGLLLSAVRSGGGIQIQAGERLQVVTPTGSIRVRDAAGLTDGTLTIASNNIWAADQALLGQLLADPNFTGRDQALLTNNGPVELRGYLEAGDVTLSARDTLFVQNSGSLISFAGITVRQNTLRIVPTGTQPLQVFAFGRRINPDGSFVTNTPFFAEVEFEGRGGAVGYTDESQFNLCFINSGVCRLPSPDRTLPGGSEIIEEPVDGSEEGSATPLSNELVDTSFADEPLIEEPVTSGGDSILWDCDNDDDGDCDEEDYDG